MRKLLQIIVVGVLLVAGCKKNKDNNLPSSTGVYIINQGNFNFGNAEISVYNPSTHEITNGLFNNANHYALGDVAQSMYIKDSLGYVVVNNSQKIEVVSLPSFHKVRTISIPNSSPRYFVPVSDSIAFVTELYANKIWIVNYITGSVNGSIITGGWTEKMVRKGNFVYVEQLKTTTGNGANEILQVSIANYTVGHSYGLNGNAEGIVLDKDGYIWVADAGDSAASKFPALVRLDDNLSISTAMRLSFSNYSHQLCCLNINGAGDRLFYYDNGVFTMSVSSNTLQPAMLINGDNKNVYVMAVDANNDDIYLSDDLDFIQSSRIYRYDNSGLLIQSFTAGIITGDFTFYE